MPTPTTSPYSARFNNTILTYRDDEGFLASPSPKGMFSCWYKLQPPNPANFSNATIISAKVPGSTTEGNYARAFDITVDYQRQLFISFNDGTTPPLVESEEHTDDISYGRRSTPIPMDGNWHHMALAWDLSVEPWPPVIMYIDGTLWPWTTIDGQPGYSNHIGHSNGAFDMKWDFAYYWCIGGIDAEHNYGWFGNYNPAPPLEFPGWYSITGVQAVTTPGTSSVAPGTYLAQNSPNGPLMSTLGAFWEARFDCTIGAGGGVTSATMAFPGAFNFMPVNPVPVIFFMQNLTGATLQCTFGPHYEDWDKYPTPKNEYKTFPPKDFINGDLADLYLNVTNFDFVTWLGVADNRKKFRVPVGTAGYAMDIGGTGYSPLGTDKPPLIWMSGGPNSFVYNKAAFKAPDTLGIITEIRSDNSKKFEIEVGVIEPTTSEPFYLSSGGSGAGTVSNDISTGGESYLAIDYDFKNNIYFDNSDTSTSVASSVMTCTRASTGYAVNSTGAWTSFAANVLRRTDLGLLTEIASTNRIRNNSMQGGVAASPGTLPTFWTNPNAFTGLTRTIVGIGTQNGVNYMDVRWSGTTGSTSATLAFEQIGKIAAVAAQKWTTSAFLSIVAGNLTNVTAISLGIYTYDGTGVFVNNTASNITVTTTQTRFSVTTTTSGGTIASLIPRIGFAWNSGAAVNFTIRIGWPQCEMLACASSPIRTTNAVVTRAGDVVKVKTPPVFGTAFTIFGQGTPNAPSNYGVYQYLVQIDNGANQNRLLLGRTAGGAYSGINQVTTQTAVLAGAWPTNTSARLVLASSNLSQGGSVNGGTVATKAVASPAGISQIRIGGPSGGGFNGYIERIMIWPNTRVNNSTLPLISGI